MELSLFKNTRHLSPERFFVVTASILSILYALITPPLQSPDELHHFYRIYQISEGEFSPVKQNNRVGGYIPDCFEGFFLRFKHIQATRDWRIKNHDLLQTFTIPYSEDGKE